MPTYSVFSKNRFRAVHVSERKTRACTRALAHACALCAPPQSPSRRPDSGPRNREYDRIWPNMTEYDRIWPNMTVNFTNEFHSFSYFLIFLIYKTWTIALKKPRKKFWKNPGKISRKIRSKNAWKNQDCFRKKSPRPFFMNEKTILDLNENQFNGPLKFWFKIDENRIEKCFKNHWKIIEKMFLKPLKKHWNITKNDAFLRIFKNPKIKSKYKTSPLICKGHTVFSREVIGGSSKIGEKSHEKI